MEKKKIDWKFAITAVICILIIGFAVSPITMQNDTYYTVKIGEHIVESGAIDGQDPFSWHELSYTYPHWLYDVIMYLIYSTFGWGGIYASTIIFACILGLVLYFTQKKLSKNAITSFVLTIGAMYLAKAYITARAQLPTFILFVLTIYCIERFLQDRKTRHVVGLIAIPILIANLHVAVWPFYFVLYMPYIGEYLIACVASWHLICRIRIWSDKILLKIFSRKEKVEKKLTILLQMDEEALKIAKENREKRKQSPYKIIVEKNNNVRWLILICLICLFTGLCTPLGTTPYTYLSKTMQGNTTQNINEHLPLTLFNQKDILSLIGITIALLSLTDIKVRLKDLFLFAGLIVLCLMSRRQISLLLFLGAFVVNNWICYFIQKYAEKDVEKVYHYANKLIGKILILGCVIWIAFGLVNPRIKLKNKFINTGTYPQEASTYILENLDVSKMRIYNEYNYGSYMLYRGIPVFIDSRADLYTPEFGAPKDIFSDFLNISNIGVYYEDKFKEYDITHVIVYKSAKLNMFLSRDSNYQEIYSDKNFVIYERLSAKTEE